MHPSANCPETPTRRGAIAVLVGLLLIPLLAFMAFSVDLGWIATTASQLQNAADASAAAGARQLVDNHAAYSTPLQQGKNALINNSMTQASTYSARFGGYNRVGEVSSLAIRPQDIVVGFTDADGVFHSTYSGYPNTVQVVARRDTSANGPLPLFFAPALGIRDSTLTATASSTIYTGLISAFDPNGGGEGTGSSYSSGGGGTWGENYGNAGAKFSCLLLPVAFDVNSWANFFATGKSPDGTIHAAGDGTAKIQVYPIPTNTPGNFGMLCIGPWTNSNAQYKNWILNGPTADDLKCLFEQGMMPVSQEMPRAWKGTPGLRSALVSEFSAIIGKPRLLPLFKPTSTSPYQAAAGNGSNATYDIVGFVGVVVTSAGGSGNSLNISVQPCTVIDPTAVFNPSTVYPAGAEPPTLLRGFTATTTKFTR